MIRKTARLGMISGSLLALAACGQEQVPHAIDAPVRAEVQMVRLTHVISAESDGTATPSNVTYVALGAFLDGIKAGYGDRLFLDGAAAASPDRIGAIADFVRGRGLEIQGFAAFGETPASGNLVLYVERHVVTPPSCNNWVDTKSDNQFNNTSSGFGCATNANLALMVADPADLVGGRKPDGTHPNPQATGRAKTHQQAAAEGGNTSAISRALGSLFGN
ncbi:CpaD family pilus assembly lipoprotein [Pseudokordiimonas caeni]|uniref:CpaD family pilus assembly lipoprotein n=1 Tax=Pseudokordiimonas caeni TaxID=2997908 RepID=UPI00281228A3|nr:CpaD family pilus assembly lipoprotein [Pseudokordiimonas caeni]